MIVCPKKLLPTLSHLCEIVVCRSTINAGSDRWPVRLQTPVVISTETESGFITEDDTSPVCHTPSCPSYNEITKDVECIPDSFLSVTLVESSIDSSVEETCDDERKIHESEFLFVKLNSLIQDKVVMRTLSSYLRNALILPQITCDLPQFQVNASALNTFKHLKLANVNCLQPGPIDILLGADVFGEIMLNRHLNVQGQSLTAMESIFGWVVLGKTKLSCQRIISNHASYNAVEFQLEKFWQLEELSETKPFTNEEIACENLKDMLR
ncbi:DUF1758 domain-containing protein [Trichonephila clavipes]|nr:DUF1758 domain-containing protein [Trichonephila clavipes]